MAKPILDDDLWALIEPLLPPPKPGQFVIRDASHSTIVQCSRESSSSYRRACVGTYCLARWGAAAA